MSQDAPERQLEGGRYQVMASVWKLCHGLGVVAIQAKSEYDRMMKAYMGLIILQTVVASLPLIFPLFKWEGEVSFEWTQYVTAGCASGLLLLNRRTAVGLRWVLARTAFNDVRSIARKFLITLAERGEADEQALIQQAFGIRARAITNGLAGVSIPECPFEPAPGRLPLHVTFTPKVFTGFTPITLEARAAMADSRLKYYRREAEKAASRIALFRRAQVALIILAGAMAFVSQPIVAALNVMAAMIVDQMKFHGLQDAVVRNTAGANNLEHQLFIYRTYFIGQERSPEERYQMAMRFEDAEDAEEDDWNTQTGSAVTANGDVEGLQGATAQPGNREQPGGLRLVHEAFKKT